VKQDATVSSRDDSRAICFQGPHTDAFKNPYLNIEQPVHTTMTKRKSANFYKTSTRPPLLLSTRHEALHDLYSKGTSLIRNSAPLGPYR